MFGYVTPYKMEMKIKDYEKFKAYYCGLCKSIKANFGNLPRFALNYDMTFLAILLDSLNDNKITYKKEHCMVHPFTKKIVIKNSEAIDFAAFCNTTLTYYKLLDNVQDDKSVKSKLFSLILGKYIFNHSKLDPLRVIIETKLEELYNNENNKTNLNIDELSHPFADLTGLIIAFYTKEDTESELYKLGYNLGKWIYLIDAYDDLEKDMKKNKFNAINVVFNKENNNFNIFSKEIEPRIEFILLSAARQCFESLNNLDIKKNKDILINILEYGLMSKIDTVFKRSCYNNEKSI